MSQPQKFHLFNCDHIYDLDVIADLINATEAKLGFDFTVEKHYFSLPRMPELSEKIIPELQMDFAVFVAHAHESRLSINEDDRGYTKVYRALLQATGGKVIIVIGGDDNYKNEDEEERFVLSRWARRMVSSQLKGEFLDGRQGFIFSWNEKHRKIHEEALLHFFDPSKKGKKFEYQPPQAMPSADEKGSSSARNEETQHQEDQSKDHMKKPGHEKTSSGLDEGGAQQVQGAPSISRCFIKPEYVTPNEEENHGDTSETEVQSLVTLKKLSQNETLMLKTRVRRGEVSFDKEDVKFMHPGWEIPPYITDHLKRETINGELSVFSDEKGNLRTRVDSALFLLNRHLKAL